MENLELIEQVLHRIGIHDNMILPDTINISGEFISENGVFKKIDRIKITINFEVQLDKIATANL